MRAGGRKAGTALLALALGAASLCTGAAFAGKARTPPLTIEVMAAEARTAGVYDEADGRPRVLIYHTHTWEAYEMAEGARYTPTETWRTKDEAHNMIRIGEELAHELEARGFAVVHDQTAFEPPNLSAAYVRSLEMIEERLDAGETYDYIFDVHRDAYSGLYNGSNTVEVNGTRAAYVMLLVGKGTGETGAGFDERPDWPKNLALAEQITAQMNGLAPGISRDVKIKPGRFNQHVSTSALLIEVGNNKNTLAEALASCPIIAQAIADVHAQNQAKAD